MLSAAAGRAPGEGLVDPSRVFHHLPGGSREEVLGELAARLAAEGAVGDPGELLRRLLDRERLGCTGLGGGVAIPHCKLADLPGVVVAFASTASPIDFGASDGIPIDLIFLVVSPADEPAAHLQALARISRLLRMPGEAESLRAAGSAQELVAVLRKAEGGLAVSA
ncbi:MAG TPA: PTS sugar transporter subunit IIA [Thermoanaerobaculia bacterium]|jgi:PTS system nitrogen regulatory IIA component|nr:PTS sugar transporter subunit IIA [Thermoanaerobaculia bacterium]